MCLRLLSSHQETRSDSASDPISSMAGTCSYLLLKASWCVLLLLTTRSFCVRRLVFNEIYDLTSSLPVDIPEDRKVVASAYISVWQHPSRWSAKSFVYKMNNTGPRRELGGQSLTAGFGLDRSR